jgi:hypothetical protein
MRSEECMNKAIVAAAACLIFLSQAGLASPPVVAPPITGERIFVRLSKPNTSYSAFMFDRNECLESAGKQVRERVWLTGVNVRYDMHGFAVCMTTKGYSRDPNGYTAMVVKIAADGSIWGVPMDQWGSPTNIRERPYN